MIFWENNYPLMVISFFLVFPKNKGIFDCEILNFQIPIKIMTFVLFWLDTSFSSFNGISKIHGIQMNFNIKDPW